MPQSIGCSKVNEVRVTGIVVLLVHIRDRTSSLSFLSKQIELNTSAGTMEICVRVEFVAETLVSTAEVVGVVSKDFEKMIGMGLDKPHPLYMP